MGEEIRKISGDYNEFLEEFLKNNKEKTSKYEVFSLLFFRLFIELLLT